MKVTPVVVSIHPSGAGLSSVFQIEAVLAPLEGFCELRTIANGFDSPFFDRAEEFDVVVIDLQVVRQGMSEAVEGFVRETLDLEAEVVTMQLLPPPLPPEDDEDEEARLEWMRYFDIRLTLDGVRLPHVEGGAQELIAYLGRDRGD